MRFFRNIQADFPSMEKFVKDFTKGLPPRAVRCFIGFASPAAGVRERSAPR